MLHGSITLGIYMFVQLWNSFPEELKNRTEERHERPIYEEKEI